MHLSPHLHQHQIQTTRLRHHWLKRSLRDCFFPHYDFSMHACQECMFDLYLILTYSFICVVTNFFFFGGFAQAWENWDKSRPGRCNNINAQSWASAGWNIVLDLVVVILPMPMLWRMNLNPRKKFLVMLMFGTFYLPRNNNRGVI